MKLVVSKTKAKSAKADSTLKPLKASFTLSADATKDLRALGEGKRIYVYINDDGTLSDVGGIFSDNPDSSIYSIPDSSLFADKAKNLYTITSTLPLKGSRVDPTFLEIKRASNNDGVVTVEGLLHNAYDPRLAQLDRSEKTEYGEGKFNLGDVRALYDGSFFHLNLSPMADSIEKVVNEQKELFQKHADDPEDTAIKSKLDTTSHILKSHANEIFKIEDDLVYYISRSGKWQAFSIAGNRKLDLWDKRRIREYAEKNGLLEEAMKPTIRQHKETYFKKSMYDRFDISKFMPLMLDEVLATADADREALEAVIKDSASKKPSDGLEPIPGIKEGVEFLPHQAYTIAKLKDRDRLPVDADPGAGKTIMIVADVLNQMAKDKAKRPLVVTRNDLLGTFASEVRTFSDLNPWIISTASIKKWKDNDFEAFLEDAKNAPENTIFITSYSWLAKDKKLVDNGQIDHRAGKMQYKKTATFPNSYRLLNDLGVDAVYYDEVHTLRNDSNYTKAASAFSKVDQVKGFTGTWMPGNLIDVLGPMGAVHSSILGRAEEFLEKYSPTKTINNYSETAPKEIRAMLQEFGMPQIRSSVWSPMMPKTHRKFHYVTFNSTQQKAYNSLLDASLKEIEEDPKLSKLFRKFQLSLEEDEQIIHPMLLARFTPLDVFLNAPAAAKSYLGAILTGDDAKGSKTEIINKIVSEHLSNPQNGKVLILVQYKESAKNIYDNLEANLKQQAAYFQGGMVDTLSRFKNPDSNLKILIGVDSTLRTGHNLQVVNCLIHADTLWLSGEMDQRERRSNRLKQQREVFIHSIVNHDSHELLKTARYLSQEHLIAKANSDFEDKTVLPHVEMTREGMRTFRTLDKIEPFVDRKEKLDEFGKQQTEKDKEFFGNRVMAPQRYEAIAKGTRLTLVPSTESFEGNFNDASYAIEEELDNMPWDAPAPKLLKFSLQNWDGRWQLICFKAADPQGFVRRMGFQLQPPYLYLEVPNKGGMPSVIKKIEDAGIEIINKDNLEKGIANTRLLHNGRQGILKQLEREGRNAIAGAVTYQMAFHFATIDGYPLVMTDGIKSSTTEVKILRKQGFKEGVSFWYLPITRTRLVALLKRIQDQHAGVRIADWEAFKEHAKTVFRSDLSEYDKVGEE